MCIPFKGHSGDEVVHQTVFWQVRAHVCTDHSELRGQAAQEQHVRPGSQSAVVKETLHSSLPALH